MLNEIRIRNFKSIKELTLDLRYALSRAPNGYKDNARIFFLECDGARANRTVPALGIFGPNASGKTSILQAASILRGMVISRFNKRCFMPNKINTVTKETESTEIGVTFSGLSKIFDYSVVYNGTGILEERLSIDKEIEFLVKNEKIVELSDRLSEKFQDIQQEFQTRCILSDSKKQERTLLWCLRKEFPGIAEELSFAFNFFKDQLAIFPSNNLPIPLAFDMLAAACEGETEQEKKENAIKEISCLLKKFDSRIESFSFRTVLVDEVNISMLQNIPFRLRPDDGGIEKVEVQTFHKNDKGSLVGFDLFEEESKGTQRLMALVALFLWATKNGKTVLIDELEASLHPLLSTSLISIFKDKRYNKSNAQLIFTTHNTDFLEWDVLQLSEVALVDPRGFNGAQVMRLSEIEGLRNANNFRRRYLNGDFGGIPFTAL
ncbi:ATP/GTP-binding protein [Parasutterella sp.]|uniref:AAA family ATPase n=1 Tax=Parasutterella sp. TaxID=2049037 RepID=UPI00205E01BF|nr:MAG TPA: AAA domain protein [Caudoviricetes sp.]